MCALIVIAVAASTLAGDVHGAALLGAMASLAYALVVGAAVVMLGSRRRVAHALAERSRRVAARIRTIFRRPEPTDGASAVDEFVAAIGRLRCARGPAARLLMTAFAGKLIGVATLSLVLVGLGVHLGPTTVLLAYALTVMASQLGPLPGGIGAAEASLGSLLVANGVAGPTTAAAVVAFRLLDLWLPLLAGAVAGFLHSRRLGSRRVRSRSQAEVAAAPFYAPLALATAPVQP
jgi:uncharacterized membrane protein YbhN (UPF0104 family)